MGETTKLPILGRYYHLIYGPFSFTISWFHQVLKDMPRIEGRPGASLPDFDFGKLKTDLQERHPEATDRDVMSAALYPQVTEDYLNFRESYGPVDKLDTRIFLTGPKVGEEFEVSCTWRSNSIFMNGQNRYPYAETDLRKGASCLFLEPNLRSAAHYTLEFSYAANQLQDELMKVFFNECNDECSSYFSLL